MIIETVIQPGKSVDNFLRHLWGIMSILDRAQIYSSLASRVDSAGTLYLRIDKQEALKGKVRLEDMDPIKVEILFRGKASANVEVSDHIRRILEELETR